MTGFRKKNLISNIEYLSTVDRNGFEDGSSIGITTINGEIGTGTKKAGVSFKIPDSDDRLGKSVGDITAGNYASHYNLLYTSKDIYIYITSFF